MCLDNVADGIGNFQDPNLLKRGGGCSFVGIYGHAQAEELLCEQGGESVAEAERDCSGEHGE